MTYETTKKIPNKNTLYQPSHTENSEKTAQSIDPRLLKFYRQKTSPTNSGKTFQRYKQAIKKRKEIIKIRKSITENPEVKETLTDIKAELLSDSEKKPGSQEKLFSKIESQLLSSLILLIRTQKDSSLFIYALGTIKPLIELLKDNLKRRSSQNMPTILQLKEDMEKIEKNLSKKIVSNLKI